MKFTQKIFIFKVFAIFITLILFAVNLDDGTVTTYSQFGSRGQEVVQIQQKLKQLGFYKGKIDGIYGLQTERAVIDFQIRNKLRIDGIAGSQTLRALGISPPTGGTSKYSNADYNLIVRMISAEARGEPYIGQVAVGAVILNRVEHPSFPNTVSGVIYQPGAFTALTDGNFYQPIVSSAWRAAQDALNGWDPSGGAIYYYNPARTTNKWMLSRPVTTVIGRHRFCK